MYLKETIFKWIENTHLFLYCLFKQCCGVVEYEVSKNAC
uniref:Uncharacterized protein n=1 Tax=Vibrio sp. FF_307 TaxID=1652834 RepID=A0A0H3ZWF4_9VIBR|nr:hypothetical protein [Vibrio sp. FF_307]